MTIQSESLSNIKGPTITFPKRFYDLASVLPTFGERSDFLFKLLAIMFDGEADEWLRNERINLLVKSACVRLKNKFPEHFKSPDKTI